MNEYELGKLIIWGQNAFSITVILDDFYKLLKAAKCLKN